jgi:glutathione S-transferase
MPFLLVRPCFGGKMIELHQYPAIWGLSSLSPFCIKVEVFLKRNNLPYRVVVEKNPARGPKGKMPFIRDGESVVADSTFIINHLTQAYSLNKTETDPLIEAQSLAFQRMIEEHLYFVLLYSRWIDPVGWSVLKREFAVLFPPLLGGPFLHLIRSQLRKQAHAQGLGRHTRKEVYEIGRRDLKAISSFLADKPFLMGDQWMAIDATLYAFLTTILKQPIDSELKAAVMDCANLVAYSKRLDKENASPLK